MKNRKKLLSFILLLLWMAVIFAFSAKEADESAGQSMSIVEAIKNAARVFFPKTEDIQPHVWSMLENYLRKFAHGLIYFVLALFCCNFVYRCKFMKKNIISALICLLYAISDEVHQLFVSGRSAQVSDVLIDFAGSLFGIVIFVMIFKRFYSGRMT